MTAKLALSAAECARQRAPRAARAACKLLEELKTVLAAYLDAKLAASPA
jgi:hypothetical protein